MKNSGRGMKSHSGHDEVSYSVLPTRTWDTDSESDDYYTASRKQNGSRESIRLEDLRSKPDHKQSEVAYENARHVRVTKPKTSQTVMFCCCFVVVATVVAVTVTWIALPYFFKKVDQPLFNKTSSWSQVYNDLGTSAVRLVDLDDDGRDDVLFAITRPANLDEMQDKDRIKIFCKKYGEAPPCMGSLVALRGYDGKELWRVKVDSELFEINCIGIDIDKDGKDDCLAAGRLSTLIAVNPKNGTILWSVEKTFNMYTWNIYQPLVLPDLDGDGIGDILVAHGGDPNFPPEAHDRKSGRLYLVSGATGKVMGQRYYDMPENKETYMSPVLHLRKDGSQFILFGSGGETVPGCFYGVSLAAFYRFVFQQTSDERPLPDSIKAPGSNKWGEHVPNRDGVFEIYRSKAKGMMVPPILADLNNDGVKDIMVTSFEGATMLLDGETLETRWQRDFKDHETYSTPTPGYFNDDDILDYMTHWSWGNWPKYKSSIVVIQDGKDGSVIWSLENAQYEMSSALSVRTTTPHMDGFIFKLPGRLGRHEHHDYGRSDSSAEKTPKKDERKKIRRHGGIPEDGEDYVPHRPICSDELVASSMVEVFLVSRSNTKNLIKIVTLEAERFYYNLTGNNYVTKRHAGKEEEEEEPLCVVLKPDERVTGSVGDLDGDGTLDLVLTLGSLGKIKNQGGSYLRMKYRSKIVKINLSDVIKHQDLTKVAAVSDIDSEHSIPVKDLKFGAAALQPWPGYLGKGTNVYEET